MDHDAAISDEQLDQWLFEFKLNGFILFRNLLPVELIDRAHEHWTRMFEFDRQHVDTSSARSHRSTGRHLLQVEGMVEKLGGALIDPILRRNPVIARLADAILGEWKYGKTQVEGAYAGSEFMGWHIDTHYKTPPSDDTAPKTIRLAFQLPLVDVTHGNGPTEVIPGSHRVRFDDASTPMYRMQQVYSTPLLMSKGDAFLRDGDLLHRGTPNLTDRPRPLYSQLYKIVPDQE